MLNTLPVVVIVSTVLGFLAGIGIGGGSLLIMYLTLLLNVPYPQARILNLLFFLPSAVIASLFRWKQGALKLGKILPAIIAGCIGAAVFSWVSSHVDISLLKKVFGILLLITGTRELLYKPKKKSTEQ